MPGADTASDDVTEPRLIRDSSRTEPLGYIPALDGLRGYSMIVVMFYHARFTFFPGGFLAVSIFFTLSGFLITSLLLREWASDRAIDMRAFWSRRFRRLLPAAWVTLAGVTVLGAFGAWDGDQLSSLHGDVPFSLLQVVNWHFILKNHTYGGSFTAPTPVEHYWSLSVEEQFYLFVPLLVLAVLGLSRSAGFRRRVRRVAGVLVVLTILSAVLNGVLAQRSIDRAYFGTDTRMAEMLIGGLLACATVWRLRFDEGTPKRVLRALGAVGLVSILVLWRIGSLRVQWMYPWGLLLTAFATCAVIIGTLQGGIASRILAFKPIAQLGRMSYGTYLVHWPIFLILTPARTGLPAAPLFAVRFVLSVAISTVIFYYVEEPIRRRRALTGGKFVRVAATTLPILLIASLAVTTGAEPTTVIQRDPTGSDPGGAVTGRHQRILLVGDRTAGVLAEALNTSAGGQGEFIAAAADGCGMIVGGWIMHEDGGAERDVHRCGETVPDWVDAISDEHPDLVVVIPSTHDAAVRLTSDDGEWVTVDDTVSDGFHSGEIASTIDALAAASSSARATLVVASTPNVLQDPIPPAPARPVLPDPEREALQSALEESILGAVQDPASFPPLTERLASINAIAANAAADRGIEFIDLAEELAAPEDAGYTLDIRSGADTPGGAAIDTIRDLLIDTSHRLAGTPPSAAPPPASLTDVALPPAPETTPRRRVGADQETSILVVGDSIAYSLGYGLVDWAEDAHARVGVAAWFGCPIARGGRYRIQRDTDVFLDSCEWATEYPRFIAEARPDVVLLSSTMWQVVDRQLPGDNTYRHMGDELLDRYVLAEFLTAVDVLASDGATVVLLTGGYVESGREKGYTGLPESDHARMDRLNELFGQVHESRPGVTELIDLQAFLRNQEGGELSPESRPDGIHFSDVMSRRIADWLGPQLDAIARRGDGVG